MPDGVQCQADVTFIVDGQAFPVAANEGDSLMEVAVRHDVPRIVGECGGSGACGTCQIVVAEDWRALAGAADEMEMAMLEANGDVPAGGRLACQIRVTPQLKGIVVSVLG